MKATVFSLAAISLLEVAVAQPHRQHAAHKAAHIKKDVVTVTQTAAAQVTTEPLIVVYVDQDGKPVSTSTSQRVVTIQPTAAGSVATAAAPPATPVTTAVPAAAATSAAASVPAGSGSGLTYSPYNSDGTCKSASQVLQDFKGFGSGYSYIRTYGTDCSTIPNVLAACKANGLKLFAGIFSLSNLDGQVNDIVSGVAGDWSSIYAVSVGNELVNSGAANAATVVAAVNNARSLLRAQSYNGPVVTVDTLVASRANPSLCDASDFCAVNCHPFFDGTVAAADSGSFLTTQLATLQNVLANKSQKIVVTETGWPWKGDSNGAAVPSVANQAAALSSIKAAFASNPAGVTLFNPYNMHWKKSSAGQFDAEPYWGFLGECPSG